MLRAEGQVQAHAAALSPDQHLPAVLIAAPSGAGKTTLTLNLARRGWAFLSDDSVTVDRDRGDFGARPMRMRFMKKDGDSTRKIPVNPEVAFPGQRLWGRTAIGALVFLERTLGERCALSAISKATALTRLLTTTSGCAPGWEREGVTLLAQLTRLPSFILHAGADVLTGGPSADIALRRCLGLAIPA